MLRTEEISNYALEEGRRLGCDDVSVVAYDSDESQVRFSNNNITLVNNVSEITLQVYIAKDRRRILGATYNPTTNGIQKFMENLFASCNALPQSDDYVPLPEHSGELNGRANFDPKVRDAPLIDYVKQAIDAAMRAGARRVSGSLNTTSTNVLVKTSTNARGTYEVSEMLLNVRAFAEDNASGHGLSCTSYLSQFDPEGAGTSAGDYAKMSLNPTSMPEGKYDVVFTPTVVANILPIASGASAFAIESGLSFLPAETEKRIGVNTLHVDDYGVYEHGLGGRIIDDEGLSTQHTIIVESGVFRNMLHNSTTARKFKSKSTGSAGIINPTPSNVVFAQGDSSFDEMIRETQNGLLVTNNWYTRYQNIKSGEYSTVPRDAVFRIEGGKLSSPIVGIRLSDSIPRQLSNISLISKERRWIKWWEVNVPTLATAMKIDSVQVTRAAGS